VDDTAARVRAAYDADAEREWRRLETGAQNRLEYLVTSEALARHLPPVAAGDGPRVLDAGGGPGRYALDLAARGYRVTLLDLSPRSLDLARRRIAEAASEVRSRVEAVVEGSFVDLRLFDEGAFGAVVCLGGALSHVVDPAQQRRALAELRRVVRPGGPVCVSVMNRLSAYRSAVQWPACFDDVFPRLLDSPLSTTGPHQAPDYLFWPEELVRLLEAVNLRVERLYGANGIGAHLQEEHLLALMDDPARWPLWRRALLATCDHPNLIGVSRHVLAVAHRPGETP
jgi:SAM-dependent methyltransferase